VGANNQLPEVGYTTALEYVFYVFFSLSLFAILISIVSDRLIAKRQKLQAAVDLAARIFLHVVGTGNDCFNGFIQRRRVKRISMIERFRQWLTDLRTNRFYAKYIAIAF
jgi:hypothetical protein